ncbi:MAG: hypothetical protein JWO45_1325 [Spartobacteria bacterium]|nr:hypothetical protein [Spartobacteria bacterium]
MLGVLYGCLGLIFLPFFAIAAVLGAFAQQTQQAQSAGAGPAALVAGVMIVVGVFIPVIYGVMGFVFGILIAAIYNLIASWIGGIEVEVE